MFDELQPALDETGKAIADAIGGSTPGGDMAEQLEDIKTTVLSQSDELDTQSDKLDAIDEAITDFLEEGN
jgi:hypothetical protein